MKNETYTRVADYYSERAHYPLRTLEPGKIVVDGSHLRYADACLPPPRRCMLWLAVLDNSAIISTQYELLDDVRGVLASIPNPADLLREEARESFVTLCNSHAPNEELYSHCGVKLYCDTAMFAPVRDPNVKKLTDETVHHAVGILVLHHPEYLLHDDAAFAYFLEDTPVSFSGSHPAGSMSDRIGDVMVETLEPYRQRGYGKAVISATTQALLERGRVAVWGTSEDNAAARRTAESVGYETFCHVFMIRHSRTCAEVQKWKTKVITKPSTATE